MDDRETAVLGRLESQIASFGKRSKYNQRAYKLLKVTTMTATGAIPAFAALGFSAAFEGCLGFLALLAESLQQLNQYHANWVTYQATLASLAHEKHLFIARAAHYRGADDPIVLLAEQVESLVSVEHAKWVAMFRDANKKDADAE